MARMVRKQIYIPKRQQRLLKQLARSRGLSEAEIIRQAIDAHVSGGSTSGQPDSEAWEKAYRFMLSLKSRGPLKASRDWKREDLYEERLSRYGRRSG